MKLLLIDDHQLFSSSLKLVMEKFHVVEKVITLDKPHLINDYLLKDMVDLILLDINLGKDNGLLIGKEIKNQFPNIPLVFLTGFDFEEYRFQAELLNASGFFSKNISPEELVNNLYQIVEKGVSFIEQEKSILTKKEKEILNYLSEGRTQSTIAKELLISRRTVNTHVQSIHDKFNVSSTSEAIIKGVKLGIISIIN
ncbi:response regulator transcription factor [Listeria monocytogenes]|nr:response regulator transcription factor [Listeria monocytogenes]EAC9598798.1 response regulator transcription factor [Listeria monocytogenes]EAC9622968.1 response regulator transcription factor [Listeria monocytogenes]EAC9818170.1 response regulator transcription factor [Listeria monocytogenes]EAD0163390.1 DNA-binding response regulator [Listeria monocytogenes]